MDTQELIELIQRALPPEILNKSGTIVYSSVSSICKGDLYIMGLNPGGASGPQIIQTLENLQEKHLNSYEDDERWGRYEQGQHPLQKNYRSLKTYLNDDKEIFSTNLIFTRSRDATKANYPEAAKDCWPVHEILIDIIDPKCLIVFGNGPISPYSFIRDHLPSTITLDIAPPKKAGHKNWVVRSSEAYIKGKKRLVIGVPHLSLYRITNRNNSNNDCFEIINWIKEKIDTFEN